MKKLVVLMLVGLVGCAESGGGGSRSSGSSSSPTVTPVVTPAPVGTVWPLSTAISTSTVGSYSCSTLNTGGVKCYDGSNIITLNGISAYTFTKIVVNTTIACVMIEPNGAAQTCTALNDPACTAPATGNLLYCWNLSDMSALAMDQGDHLGFPSPTYSSGPKDIFASGSDICLVQSTYLAGSSFVQEDTVCGDNIHSWGYIQ